MAVSTNSPALTYLPPPPALPLSTPSNSTLHCTVGAQTSHHPPLLPDGVKWPGGLLCVIWAGPKFRPGFSHLVVLLQVEL